MTRPKKVINGVEFDANTPEKVVNILLSRMGSGQRLRLFYGDPKTGRDWGESFDIMGYIGRSTGNVKIPLLVNSSRSMGGSAILTGNIVRITADKHNLYVNPKYTCKVIVRMNKVYLNGKLYGEFPNKEKAQKYAAFLRGDSNVKG